MSLYVMQIMHLLLKALRYDGGQQHKDEESSTTNELVQAIGAYEFIIFKSVSQKGDKAELLK